MFCIILLCAALADLIRCVHCIWLAAGSPSDWAKNIRNKLYPISEMYAFTAKEIKDLYADIYTFTGLHCALKEHGNALACYSGASEPSTFLDVNNIHER